MKIKLGVLFGGKSVEHEISVISAIQAIGYLDREKYDVIPIYMTKQNEFYVGEDIDKIESYTKLASLLKRSQRVVLLNDENRVKIFCYPFKKLKSSYVDYLDIIFPIVHGTNVEDGALQGFLKTLDVPFVGCDVLSSAVGMDKAVMKSVLKDAGIPVLPCVTKSANEFDSNAEGVVCEIENAVGYPIIVKPANLGSSIGISRADDKKELLSALETAFSYAKKVVCEKCVTSLKEINCSVLGDSDSAEASECEEPVSSGEILDFNDKYIGGQKGAKGAKTSGSKGMATLKRKIPADISDAERETIRTLAVKAFRALGCSGVSRIDFMKDLDTGEIFLNEINTIPGSLSFYLWEPLGVSYTKLLDQMISLSLKRNREESKITYAFDSSVLEGVKLGGGQKGSKS